MLDILTYPDERLRQRAEPVVEVTDAIRHLVDEMAATMYGAPGIGLAANQVGVLKRIAVIDVDYPDGEPNLLVLINPEITDRQGQITWEEGCLSFPDVREDVSRADKVTVNALDRNGKPFELIAEGLLAVAIQHELDHLDGVLLIDQVSFLKRQMIHRQLVKNKRAG
ncbi:MAG: peptide deformylase [Myxococcota bacterium]|nr:peptide deformylase [Myxococcota bacterium]